MMAHALAQGALVMACAVAGLFFFRFWKSAQDRLFLFFSLAFWVLGAHWLVMGVLDVSSEIRHYYYLPRLGAFVLIVLGILDKNRRARRPR